MSLGIGITGNQVGAGGNARNAVLYVPLVLTDALKELARLNIDAASKTALLEGSLMPAIALNLYSPTDLALTNLEFILRTTGGSASIRSGEAKLNSVEGNCITSTKTPNVVTYKNYTEANTFSVIVTDQDTLEAAIIATGQGAGSYLFTKDGDGNFKNGDTNLIIVTSPSGTITHGVQFSGVSFEDTDYFTITYDPTKETKFSTEVYCTSRMTATYDDNTIINKLLATATLPNEIVNATLTYDGTHWKNGSTNVNLSDYGVTLTGAVSGSLVGDIIVLLAKRGNFGTILFATPTALKALGLNGLNSFDANTMVLAGYTINSSGNVVALTGRYICYVKAAYNADNTLGYTIYDTSKTIVRVGFNLTAPTPTTTGITVSAHNKLLSHVTFSLNGYVMCACSDPNSICIHPTWSGYLDSVYSAYSESIVEIPTETSLATPITLWSVGNYRDKIDFTTYKYTKKISRGASTLSAINSYLEAFYQEYGRLAVLGLDYDYDNSYMYYYDPDNELSINISTEYGNVFYCNDFSTEEFIGTNVPVVCSLTYGANLVDKLRTDVLTKNDFGTFMTNNIETKAIATTDWTASSTTSPYTVTANVSTTKIIGLNSIVELINDLAVLFATYGFAILSINGSTITIGALSAPSTNVSLKISII